MLPYLWYNIYSGRGKERSTQGELKKFYWKSKKFLTFYRKYAILSIDQGKGSSVEKAPDGISRYRKDFT